jgi:hypothetical protein
VALVNCALIELHSSERPLEIGGTVEQRARWRTLATYASLLWFDTLIAWSRAWQPISS